MPTKNPYDALSEAEILAIDSAIAHQQNLNNFPDMRHNPERIYTLLDDKGNGYEIDKYMLYGDISG